MQNKHLSRRDSLGAKMLFWFGIIMAAVFICCGFAFLLSDFLLANVPKPNRTYLGFVFIVYGAFRGTRQYNQYKKMQQREKDVE